MFPSVTDHAARNPPGPSRPAALAGAGVLAGVVVFFLAAVAVLSSAIDWPASLDLPAADVLPLLERNADSVAWGYFLYLMSSLLIAPAAILLSHGLGVGRTLATALAVTAGLTAVLRAIGIVRWLTVLPDLADGYTTAADRPQRELLFAAIDSYGGAIGEILGTGLTGGLWLLLLGAALRTGARLPRWLAPTVMAVGVLTLLGTVLDVGAIAVPVSQVLYLVVAILVALRAGRAWPSSHR